ncbi:MAG TPA: Usg family protein [Patescibacteria group bacterium]|nr:Usg family protein [Patescibacteria group bacterium]
MLFDDAVQSEDYRLTQAEILYHKPNSPHLLESIMWQDYDVAPDYPELQKFLELLALHVAGSTVHSVRVASLDEIRPVGMIYAAYSTAMH